MTRDQITIHTVSAKRQSRIVQINAALSFIRSSIHNSNVTTA